MAATASMLLLLYHNKSSSPPSPLSSTPSPTYFSGAKFSVMTWVRQDKPIFKGKSQGKESFMAGPSSPANDSDKVMRFEEALEHSFCSMANPQLSPSYVLLEATGLFKRHTINSPL
ncbi:hypothetical protein Peur_001654 [Populus x canadensis]